jgi:hypothetical protein
MHIYILPHPPQFWLFSPRLTITSYGLEVDLQTEEVRAELYMNMSFDSGQS